MLYVKSISPENRVVPSPSIGLKTRSTDTKELVKSWFEHQLGNGFYSDVTRCKFYVSNTCANAISVEGFIKNRWSTPVGDFYRNVFQDVEGIHVEHCGFDMYKYNQGEGLGSKFIRNCFEQYQENGIDRVYNSCGSTVGGYSWARMGFRIAPEASRHSVLTWLLTKIEKQIDYAVTRNDISRGEARECKVAVGKMRSDSAAGKDIQPIDISQIGEYTCKWKNQDGNITWPGKQGLLKSFWESAYYFDGRNRGN